MKVSLNWIRKLTEITLEEDQLISKIRSQLGEVEEVIDFDKKYKDIVLAKIVDKEDHPEADKLAVYKISLGRKEKIQIVAGDKDLQIGDLVAYFKPGAKVPYNPHPEKYDGVVRAVKLRGVESNGMIASGRELDINNDHEKVMVIETEMKPGTPIIDVLEMNDTVIDIENKALTNRADCFSTIGIAREIAGIQGIPFKTPTWLTTREQDVEKPKDTKLPLEIKNEAYNLCPRYSAATISGVTIKGSPLWLQSILVKSGMRPINNIVDITNYIMLLTGQPLHAFDYDKLRKKDPNGESSAYITVRLAKNEEKLNALNQNVYDLHDTNLVICDSTNPVALAGMIGGADTEIDENTKNVVLESANFDMYNNRKSSMILGVFTDAVTRYSKGQDPAKTVPAMRKAVEMISELADGVLEAEYDIRNDSFGEDRLITIDVEKANLHLGTRLTRTEIRSILENVELETTTKGNLLTVTVPSFRSDLQSDVDIHEEIGRLYGYNNIQITLPKRDLSPAKHNELLDLKWKIRELLAKDNVNEVYSYNFVSKELLSSCGLDIADAYKIRNPLSPDLEYMRPALLPSLIDVGKKNLNTKRGHIILYGMNKTHRKSDVAKDGLPIELEELALLLSVTDPKASCRYDGSAYYNMKVYLDDLLNSLYCSHIQLVSPDKSNLGSLPGWIRSAMNMYDTNAVALVKSDPGTGSTYLGLIGELSPRVKQNHSLPEHSAAIQLNVEELRNTISRTSTYREPSKYPSLSNDICFELDRDVPYAVIEDLLNRSLEKSELIYSVSPIDIYMSDELKEKDKRRLTFRIEIAHKEKTLENTEIEKVIKRMTRYIRRETNAVVV